MEISPLHSPSNRGVDVNKSSGLISDSEVLCRALKSELKILQNIWVEQGPSAELSKPHGRILHYVNLLEKILSSISNASYNDALKPLCSKIQYITYISFRWNNTEENNLYFTRLCTNLFVELAKFRLILINSCSVPYLSYPFQMDVLELYNSKADIDPHDQFKRIFVDIRLASSTAIDLAAKIHNWALSNRHASEVDDNSVDSANNVNIRAQQLLLDCDLSTHIITKIASNSRKCLQLIDNSTNLTEGLQFVISDLRISWSKLIDACRHKILAHRDRLYELNRNVDCNRRGILSENLEQSLKTQIEDMKTPLLINIRKIRAESELKEIELAKLRQEEHEVVCTVEQNQKQITTQISCVEKKLEQLEIDVKSLENEIRRQTNFIEFERKLSITSIDDTKRGAPVDEEMTNNLLETRENKMQKLQLVLTEIESLKSNKEELIAKRESNDEKKEHENIIRGMKKRQLTIVQNITHLHNQQNALNENIRSLKEPTIALPNEDDDEVMQSLCMLSQTLRLFLKEVVMLQARVNREAAERIKYANVWQEKLIEKGSDRTVIFADSGALYDDKVDNSKRQIRAASLNQLIIRLTDEKQMDMQFVKTFIATYESFVTAEVFLQKLIERYCVPRSLFKEMPEPEWRRTVVTPIQLRVFNVIKIWLDTRFEDFRYDLMKQLMSFIDRHLLPDSQTRMAQSLSGIIKRKMKQIDRHHSLLSRARVEGSSDDVMMNLSEEVIAYHLTIIDFERFRQIQTVELMNKAWMRANLRHICPNVMKMIERFNTVSKWVTTTIVMPEKLKQRSKLLAKFIRVAQIIREQFHNYNTLLCILAGLNNSAVHRLKYTKEDIPKRLLEIWGELDKLMKSDNSFKLYREEVAFVNPPKLPYFGLYLTDIVFVEDGNPDNIDGLINFRKRGMLYNYIDTLRRYQQNPYNTDDVVPNIYHYFENLKYLEDDEFWNISRQREPKNCEKSELL